MKLKTGLLAVALATTVAGAANAQMFGLGTPGDGITPRSQNEMMMGPYVSLGGGVNFTQASRFDAPDVGFNNLALQGFKTGWTANGALGYAFGFGPRLEVEVNYRRNHMRDEITGGFCDGAPVDDDFSRLNQLGVMANAAYDIYTGTRIVPYIGAGVGGVRAKFRHDSACMETEDRKQWLFAVQGFAGADFLLTQAARIGVRYTFMHTNDITHIDGVTCCPTFFTEGRFDPNNHSITLQLAYNFGQPRVIAAPAPVAAPAPALQRNFLVFFDFDKSDITPEADRVIVQAANNAKTASVTRITLTGHTDRAGPVAYNQRLSERRAESVKARLIREGIPAGSIVTIGRGETQNLVPTADGVREPQNRRVEIVL